MKMTTENNLREYTETRMKMYIDMIEKKTYTKEEEKQFYDNIMELMSCLDYCFVGLSTNGLQTLTEVKNRHAIISNKNELNII